VHRFRYILIFFCLVSFLAVISNLPILAAAEHGKVEHSSSTAVHEAADEEEHGGGAIKDLIARIINFILMVIILAYGIKKGGFVQSLKERMIRIRERMEGLKKEKEEREAQFRDIESKLREFEKEKEKILEEFRKEGEQEKERIIREAQEKAKRIVESARISVSQEMEAAKQQLRAEIMDLAAKEAEKILSKVITEKDQENLIDEFIQKVEKLH